MKERLELAVEIARAAGKVTLEHFARPGLEVERKADASPVTVADREAERLLRRRIESAFPDDAILGEEFPETEGDSGFRWILDPIDGTRSFVRGVPLYGTLVGVERDGSPAIGVIHVPALDETLYAARDGGAWHAVGDAEPLPAQVSELNDPSRGLFLTTDVTTWARREADDVRRRLEARFGLSRTWGDCYGYLMVATGRAEVMVDPFMSLWDAAALVPVVEEAGGRFTDWAGRATADGGDGVATNGLLHDRVLEILGG